MKENRKRIKEITVVAICTSLALLLSYVEMLIPVLIQGVPGIKMGLPNIVIVFALYLMGTKKAVLISLIRVAIMSMMFGNFTYFLYSIAGAALSLCVMILIKKLDFMSSVGVSVAGALAHNVGQILVAMMLMQTSQIGWYLIVLSITGVISGIFVGLCGALVVKRMSKLKI